MTNEICRSMCGIARCVHIFFSMGLPRFTLFKFKCHFWHKMDETIDCSLMHFWTKIVTRLAVVIYCHFAQFMMQPGAVVYGHSRAVMAHGDCSLRSWHTVQYEDYWFADTLLPGYPSTIFLNHHLPLIISNRLYCLLASRRLVFEIPSLTLRRPRQCRLIRYPPSRGEVWYPNFLWHSVILPNFAPIESSKVFWYVLGQLDLTISACVSVPKYNILNVSIFRKRENILIENAFSRHLSEVFRSRPFPRVTVVVL